MRIRQADLFATLLPEWPDDPLPAIRAQTAGQKVVVVDDDPTGTQTVHGIPVLADWSVPTLCTELASDLPAFYLLIPIPLDNCVYQGSGVRPKASWIHGHPIKDFR